MIKEERHDEIRLDSQGMDLGGGSDDRGGSGGGSGGGGMDRIGHGGDSLGGPGNRLGTPERGLGMGPDIILAGIHRVDRGGGGGGDYQGNGEPSVTHEGRPFSHQQHHQQQQQQHKSSGSGGGGWGRGGGCQQPPPTTTTTTATTTTAATATRRLLGQTERTTTYGTTPTPTERAPRPHHPRRYPPTSALSPNMMAAGPQMAMNLIPYPHSIFPAATYMMPPDPRQYHTQSQTHQPQPPPHTPSHTRQNQ
ncbi:hypothetical protein Pcinc_039399 [Petrolisthes cinctipes]|uniref:Uncharacterized protein n=1 Tax=Petrolisthes cinctipes TaxID=88211 RepID=A0AAE1BNP8_PETCI|nr:hypothetical protein Pcinc_039399 [Petrolisthes cinctipes]